MAQVHLKVGGANSSPYATWANGATALATGVAAAAAGDDILLGTAYTETTATAGAAFPGTPSSPNRIICGTEGASSGLSAAGTGGVIDTTAAAPAYTGSYYAYGVTYRCSTGGSSVVAALASGSGNVQVYKSCRFEITNGGSSSAWHLGSVSASTFGSVTFLDCVWKFGAPQQRIQCEYNVTILGGSLDVTAATPAALFVLSSAGRGARLLVDGFDASNAGTAFNIVDTIGGGASAKFRRWKLPSGWTGRPVASGAMKAGGRIELVDYSVGTTLYRAYIEDYAGTVRDEGAVKVTAQTSSDKMVSNANCSVASPLRTLEYLGTLAGGAQTISLDICTDNVTLTDAECWIEIDYLPSATSMLSIRVTDGVDPVTTPAAQASSSTTWTTTGLTTPIRQTVSASVTAGAASAAIARLVLVKPSTTVYVSDTPTVA